MAQIVLGLGDYAASKTPGDILKTYALGSCVAVILIDRTIGAVGMAHIVLPNSSIDLDKSRTKPGYFADSGIAALIREMQKLGSTHRLIVKLVGGAQVADPNQTFNVGKRNILAVKKILWSYRLGALSEEVGGSTSRTVSVAVDDPRVIISNPGQGNWEI